MLKRTLYLMGVSIMVMLDLIGGNCKAVSPVHAAYENVEDFPGDMEREQKKTIWEISERPEKVVSLKKKFLDAHTIRLTWREACEVDGYRIYRRSSGQRAYHLIAAVKRRRFTDRNLSEKKSYRYRVVPVLKFHGKLYQAKGAGISYRYRKLVSTDHQKYSYAEMVGDLKALKKRYPGKIRFSSVGKSEDGREIYDVVLGNPHASKKFLVIGAIHAREYMTSLLCMRQIEYYLENYFGELDGKSVKKTLNRVSIHFIPMANPDGVSISQSGIGTIRSAALKKKLRKFSSGSASVWKANARGVDLNRNYPVEFQKMGKRGPEGFSGKKASSESETRAIIRLVSELKIQGLKGVISYHATGSIVFGDYKNGTDFVGIQTSQMYDLARQISGYASAANYQSSSHGRGNLREYILYKQALPCITIEIGKRPCPNPIWEFPSIWKSNGLLVLNEARLFE